MPYDSREIANYILDAGDRRGLPLTNLALNKIIYFSHGWSLATRGEAIVRQAFEAWEHGPVLPTIYHQFKSFGSRTIGSRATCIDLATGRDVVLRHDLDLADRAFVEEMLDFYGPMPGSMLSHMSHEKDAPWHRVRFQTANPGLVIPDTLIKEYFEQKLRSRKSKGYV